ncbi:MAG: hypothetical protein GEU80_11695 [Dehalococcoidia bacterium]|nr:hypothetical protein [Dehalococcoidia bacterium]
MDKGRERRSWLRWSGLVGLLGAALLLAAACTDDNGDGAGEAGSTATSTAAGGETASATSAPAGGEPVVVSSFDFDESVTLAWIYATALEEAGFEVDTSKLRLGNPREIIQPALESGEIDLIPEYIGSLLTYLGGEPTSDAGETAEAGRAALEGSGIALLETADAQTTNQIVVTRELADEHSLTTVSDLAAVAGDLRFGAPLECPERQFCAIGLSEVYGVEFGELVPLDFGARVTSLEEGAIDVALLFSTDAVIQANEWVALEDDMALQPAENIAPAVRTEVLDAYGDELRDALDRVTAELTTEDLRAMNFAVQAADPRQDHEDVARQWLIDKGLIEE